MCFHVWDNREVPKDNKITTYIFKNKQAVYRASALSGPGKHEKLAQRWFTVGPPSTTSAQQQTKAVRSLSLLQEAESGLT